MSNYARFKYLLRPETQPIIGPTVIHQMILSTRAPEGTSSMVDQGKIVGGKEAS